ncbi:winged helix-turn-helix domain-containing protein [Streptomyces boncukensis]|uniref:GntR family transcriptional regulator n=1 Tax=Streptomyces boncukensis TaxID=2711219 RepID=UPI0030BA0EA9
MTTAENDPRAPFEQLADDLREQIRSGDIAPGQKLPSVRELTERLGFASATVQKALRVLRGEGWIFTTGRGSFAHDPESPYGGSAPPVTAEQFAELKDQLTALTERVRSLEQRLPEHSGT